MIVILAGGVGAARFLEGLITVVPQEQLFIIGNTADDRDFYGLHVSPDLDILMYTLAGIVNTTQGWGIQEDTYTTMKQLTRLGNADWFLLGDKDLATHIHRTQLLHQGKTLCYVTQELTKKFGLTLTLVPMSNDLVQTHILTPTGQLHFEEYFVKRRCADSVLGISYIGAENAKPSPGILKAIAGAEIIILAPSNPLVSIGSILAVPGIKNALCKTPAKIVAISPIINGSPIKGPADKLMQGMNMEVSSRGIANYYKEFLDIMVIDILDASLQQNIQKLGIKTIVTHTLMKDLSAKTALARTILTAVSLR